MKALLSSGTPKGYTVMPGRPWKPMVAGDKNYFPGEERHLHNSRPDQEHPPGGRDICVKVNNQETTSPE